MSKTINQIVLMQITQTSTSFIHVGNRFMIKTKKLSV